MHGHTTKETGTVYGLYDPLTDRLVYIGSTTQPLNRRLTGHLHTPAARIAPWVATLKAMGRRPIIRPIHEGVSVDVLLTLEQEEIEANARDHGLLNLVHAGQRSPSPADVLTWLSHNVWADLGRNTNA